MSDNGDNQEIVAAPEPVVAIYPDGVVHIGQGYTIGDVLTALDHARRTVLGIVPNRPPSGAQPQ